MAVPKLSFTPVVAPRGRRVHAIGLLDPSGRALCSRPTPRSGWRLTGKRVDCPDCKATIGYPRASRTSAH